MDKTLSKLLGSAMSKNSEGKRQVVHGEVFKGVRTSIHSVYFLFDGICKYAKVAPCVLTLQSFNSLINEINYPVVSYIPSLLLEWEPHVENVRKNEFGDIEESLLIVDLSSRLIQELGAFMEYVSEPLDRALSKYMEVPKRSVLKHLSSSKEWRVSSQYLWLPVQKFLGYAESEIESGDFDLAIAHIYGAITQYLHGIERLPKTSDDMRKKFGPEIFAELVMLKSMAESSFIWRLGGLEELDEQCVREYLELAKSLTEKTLSSDGLKELDQF